MHKRKWLLLYFIAWVVVVLSRLALYPAGAWGTALFTCSLGFVTIYSAAVTACSCTILSDNHLGATAAKIAEAWFEKLLGEDSTLVESKESQIERAYANRAYSWFIASKILAFCLACHYLIVLIAILLVSPLLILKNKVQELWRAIIAWYY